MKSNYLAIIAGSIAGIIALFFFFQHRNSTEESFFAVFPFSNTAQSTSTASQLGGDTLETSAALSADTHNIPSRYYSSEYKFFFNKPTGFRVTEIPDDTGAVILAEGSNGESFQIFIIPFDESGPLTPSRIQKDLPQKIIENPRSGKLDGTQAVAFSSRDGTEKVFEIWFIHGGYLYQITTNASFTDGLQNILQTWKFTS